MSSTPYPLLAQAPNGSCYFRTETYRLTLLAFKYALSKEDWRSISHDAYRSHRTRITCVTFDQLSGP